MNMASFEVALPPHEPDSSSMVESMAEQYRAQAKRYNAMADQAVDPAREALYRRLERGYLTLADLAPREAARARSRGQEAHHRLMLDALATMAAFAIVLAVVARLV